MNREPTQVIWRTLDGQFIYQSVEDDGTVLRESHRHRGREYETIRSGWPTRDAAAPEEDG